MNEFFEKLLMMIDECMNEFFAKHESVRCTGQSSSSGHSYIVGPVVLKNDNTTVAYQVICRHCGSIIEGKHEGISQGLIRERPDMHQVPN